MGSLPSNGQSPQQSRVLFVAYFTPSSLASLGSGGELYIVAGVRCVVITFLISITWATHLYYIHDMYLLLSANENSPLILVLTVFVCKYYQYHIFNSAFEMLMWPTWCWCVG